MKHTINDGVRMVGQLLLHRPTTYFHARDKEGGPVTFWHPEAYCFCYIGALQAVSNVLHIPIETLWGKTVKLTGIRDGEEWDSIGAKARKSVAVKMCRVTEP